MKHTHKFKLLFLFMLLLSNAILAQEDALKILENGNVGINNTSPTEKLDVNGNIKSSQNIHSNKNITASGNINSNGNINSKGKLQENGYDLLPKGTIVMWTPTPITTPITINPSAACKWDDSKGYLFDAGYCVEYSLTDKTISYKKQIKDIWSNWPDAFLRMDAILNWANEGKVFYIFKGSKYITYTKSSKKFSQPTDIEKLITNGKGNNKIPFNFRIDALTNLNNKVYLFYGKKYLRCNNEFKVDQDPSVIKGRWSGIKDNFTPITAVYNFNGQLMFFNYHKYFFFDIKEDAVKGESNLISTIKSLPESPKFTIPEGWAICNGANGTPDLRDRFIVGAGNYYKSNSVGGEDRVKLRINEMPEHRHYISKYYLEDWGTSNLGSGTDKKHRYLTADKVDNYQYRSNKYTADTGRDNPHENRPPYYALYYIMKL